MAIRWSENLSGRVSQVKTYVFASNEPGCTKRCAVLAVSPADAQENAPPGFPLRLRNEDSVDQLVITEWALANSDITEPVGVLVEPLAEAATAEPAAPGTVSLPLTDRSRSVVDAVIRTVMKPRDQEIFDKQYTFDRVGTVKKGEMFLGAWGTIERWERDEVPPVVTMIVLKEKEVRDDAED